MEESLPRLSVIAKRMICVNASSTSFERAGAFVAIQQRAAITPANQLDATLFLKKNMAHLLTWTTHVSPSSRR